MAAALIITRSRPGCQIPSSSSSFKTAAVVFRKIHTSVWWDINECKVPKGCDPSSIAGNITAALAKLNYSAPVTFSAHGNMNRIPLKVRHSLSDSGVSLIQVPGDPSDFKYTGHNLCTENIGYALSSRNLGHRAPGNFLIISGDGNLNEFTRWRKWGYNILLATPRKVSYQLKMRLDPPAIWRWASLRAGGAPEWTAPH